MAKEGTKTVPRSRSRAVVRLVCLCDSPELWIGILLNPEYLDESFLAVDENHTGWRKIAKSHT